MEKNNLTPEESFNIINKKRKIIRLIILTTLYLHQIKFINKLKYGKK